MSQQVIAYKAALASIPGQERYVEVFSRGSASAGVYAPMGTDEQSPHDQDEFYIVVNGSGFFDVDGNREPFVPGDLLFVAAGTPHKFEDFTPDLAVWAIFCDSGA
jgi:mannose-6-phosphate isomerase-like protein (cupin superfamily)